MRVRMKTALSTPWPTSVDPMVRVQRKRPCRNLQPRQHECIEKFAEQVGRQRSEHESRAFTEHARVRRLIAVVRVGLGWR